MASAPSISAHSIRMSTAHTSLAPISPQFPSKSDLMIGKWEQVEEGTWEPRAFTTVKRAVKGTVRDMVRTLEYRRERIAFLRFVKFQLERAAHERNVIRTRSTNASNHSRMLFVLQDNFVNALYTWKRALENMGLSASTPMESLWKTFDRYALTVLQETDKFGYLIPDEVLAIVFSHLGIKAIPGLSLVCKHWSTVCNNDLLWHCFYLQWKNPVNSHMSRPFVHGGVISDYRAVSPHQRALSTSQASASAPMSPRQAINSEEDWELVEESPDGLNSATTSEVRVESPTTVTALDTARAGDSAAQGSPGTDRRTWWSVLRGAWHSITETDRHRHTLSQYATLGVVQMGIETRTSGEHWSLIDVLSDESGHEQTLSSVADSRTLAAVPHFESYEHACKCAYYGLRLWNTSADKAITYLQEKQLLPKPLTPEAVVNLLQHDEILHAKRGAYLARRDPFAQRVLVAYANRCNFKGMHIVDAVRKMVTLVHPTGESQAISRLVDAFSQVYFEQNRAFAASTDAVHILFYSILLLNTDLHNPAVKKHKKMTLSTFTRNMRDMEFGFDHSLLTEIYMDVKYCELKSKPHWTRRTKRD